MGVSCKRYELDGGGANEEPPKDMSHSSEQHMQKMFAFQAIRSISSKQFRIYNRSTSMCSLLYIEALGFLTLTRGSNGDENGGGRLDKRIPLECFTYLHG